MAEPRMKSHLDLDDCLTAFSEKEMLVAILFMNE
jgi:hypothetical protein